jgi:hypothetical protein
MSRQSREAVQSCASEFICFITNEAVELSNHDKRRTITGTDLTNALTNLGFEEYQPLLQIFIEKYRRASRGDAKEVKRGRKVAHLLF